MTHNNKLSCSTHECANGHIWPAQLAITNCKGCGGPLIAIRMVNCPICNEPASTSVLRADYLGGAHPVTKTCKNEYHLGPEYLEVSITHKHTQWAEALAPAKTEITSQKVEAKQLEFDFNSEGATCSEDDQ